MALVQPLTVPTAAASLAAAQAGAPAILDIEASGFGRDSYPIEIGFVLPDGSAFCSLIRPAGHWTHWDSAAEQVHQIHRETLLVRGRPVGEVARWLNDQLHGLTLYSDGWAHDYPWLGALYEEAGLVPSFRLDNLRSLLSDAQARDWSQTKQAVSNELQLTRHRASADARLLQKTLLRLREHAA